MLQEWLQLDNRKLAQIVAQKSPTAVVYLNGTRRWFLSQHKNWADYARVMQVAQQEFSQLLYEHGLQTLIQPVFGYDLLTRGDDYFKLAVEQGLAQMLTPTYRAWYHQTEVGVNLYGNWRQVLSEKGLARLADGLADLITESAVYTSRRLFLGVFADRYLDNITALAKTVDTGEALLQAYYGQPVGPVNLIIGSGQPAIWDVPLLDINKASLYFLQAPTFCLEQVTLRRILYDCIYERVNDDELYDHLTPQTWLNCKVLGIGQQTSKGWIAL